MNTTKMEQVFEVCVFARGQLWEGLPCPPSRQGAAPFEVFRGTKSELEAMADKVRPDHPPFYRNVARVIRHKFFDKGSLCLL